MPPDLPTVLHLPLAGTTVPMNCTLSENHHWHAFSKTL